MAGRVYHTESPPPTPPFWRELLIGLAVQFVGYMNLTLNFRAIAHEQYAVIVLTDAAAVAISYFIIRRVVKQESGWMLVGMVIGGATAGVVGTWLTSGWTS